MSLASPGTPIGGPSSNPYEYLLDIIRKSRNQSLPPSFPPPPQLFTNAGFAYVIIADAVPNRATAISIEQKDGFMQVYFVVDEEDIARDRLPFDIGELLVIQLKSLAGINPAVKNQSQRGRFKATIHGIDVDFDVEIAITNGAEKVVVHISQPPFRA